MTAIEIKAPGNIYDGRENTVAVFLSGSIDMGEAPTWRARVIEALPDWVVAYNPRRDDWGDDWGGVEDPRFVKQVEWEIEAMEAADIIAVHFVPGAQSPITLLEFGLWAKSGKLLVSCPEGYFRRGNVLVTAKCYGVPVYDSLDEMIEAVVESAKENKWWLNR